MFWPQLSDAWALGPWSLIPAMTAWIQMTPDEANFLFLALFVFRYLRMVVHLFAFCFLYKPCPLPTNPKYLRRDCTVIVPTMVPDNPDFTICMRSCFENTPAHIIIVTVGPGRLSRCREVVGPLQNSFPKIRVTILNCPVANKRKQIATALPHVKSEIVVLLDEDVFWPSLNFLPAALAPFQHDRVGGVGTNRRVRKIQGWRSLRSFRNMLGGIFLEHQDFELRATNVIDGGVSVISGQTALYRTHILKDPNFIRSFTNEKFFFGRLGPLHADGDQFITRWLVRSGYLITIQHCQDAVTETSLGTWPNIVSQCVQWSCTTWRSNLASLFTDRTVWVRQPWSVYAIHLTSLIDFSLFYDVALLYTLSLSSSYDPATVASVCAWIFLTKTVRLTPYFWRHPENLLMLPAYIIFACFTSLLKLYALVTIFDNGWHGRDLPIDQSSDSSSDDGHSNDDCNNDDNTSRIDYDTNDDDDETYYPGSDTTQGSSEYRSPSSGSPSWSSSSCQSDPGQGGNKPGLPPPSSANNGSKRNVSRNGKFDYSKLQFGEKPSLPPYGRRRHFETPWGAVSPLNPHTKSANVLDGCKLYSDYRTSTSHQYHVFEEQVSPGVEDWLENNTDDPMFYPELSSLNSNNCPIYPDISAFEKQYPPTTTERIHASFKARIEESTKSPQHSTSKCKSSTYQRTWIRGARCDKLHYDACQLGPDHACRVTGAVELPAHVVPGRPRM